MTKQDYLNNTYNFNSTAQVIKKGTDENGKFLIFDKTIFYPQGGGQPSDNGKIIYNNNDIPVNFVKIDDDMIKHYADYDKFNIQIGDNVEMFVDEENRLRNAKNHTAGHLISMIVEDLNIGLEAVKGYHFDQGSYVEFKGVKPQNKEEITVQINEILKDNINNKLPVNVTVINEKEMREKYGINTEYLNTDSIRAVFIGDYKPIPCGGTHIKSLDEFEQIMITKIKSKKDNIRFSYVVS